MRTFISFLSFLAIMGGLYFLVFAIFGNMFYETHLATSATQFVQINTESTMQSARAGVLFLLALLLQFINYADEFHRTNTL